MKTTVVHVREPHDVYIGRPSKWGNPFVVGRDGPRGECVRLHREWIVTQSRLLVFLPELRGKRLGCWCKAPQTPNRACHGDILADLANALPDPRVDDIDLSWLVE